MSREANPENDPYVYPGTSVLRNIPDIRDAQLLSQFESDHFFARILELGESPIHGSFDSAHLGRIHEYLFQDVYAWAGRFRTVAIAKGDSFFARPEHVAGGLENLCQKLANENALQKMEAAKFCQRAAHYFGELNALHPFREGNGRAQREFMRELAAHTGYELSWDMVTADEMLAASLSSFHRGSDEAFAAILERIIRTAE